MKQIVWFRAEYAPRFMVETGRGYVPVRRPAKTAEELREFVESLEQARPLYAYTREYLERKGVVDEFPEFCSQCGSLGADLNGLCHVCAGGEAEVDEYDEDPLTYEHGLYMAETNDPFLGW